jgi:hypothetical protein
MLDLIKYLCEQLNVIRKAPVLIILVVVLCFVGGYQTARWRYKSILELNSERLLAKDDLLDEYRERLHYLPAHGSEYSRLSHSELQSQALKFVAELRKWIATRNSERSQREAKYWLEMSQANDEAERRRIWNEQTADILQSSGSMQDEYSAKFKVKAIVLHDELLTRVPHSESRVSSYNHRYEFPTNPIGIGMVADDLEQLARQLQ